MELIQKARSEGMKFYGLGIDVREHQLDMLDDPKKRDDEIHDGYTFLKQCDYRYLYENGLQQSKHQHGAFRDTGQ